jgi:hypothetical protein
VMRFTWGWRIPFSCISANCNRKKFTVTNYAFSVTGYCRYPASRQV